LGGFENPEARGILTKEEQEEFDAMYEQFAGAEAVQGEIRAREKAHLKRWIEVIEAVEEVKRKAKEKEGYSEN
jgi:hypothetical protein